jgi:hypothetical protein
MTRDHQLPLGACVACGYVVTAATGIGTESEPSPGDMSICLSCGALLLFDAERRPSRVAPDGWLDTAPPDVRAMVLGAQDLIRRRGPIPKPGGLVG